MLHILLLILKIIGIILAVILGIIVLLVCIVLFVPIRYRAEGESSGTLDDLKVHGQVSWLFGLLKVVVDIKNKTAGYYVKIAWKRLGDEPEPDQKREDVSNDEDYDACEEDWKELEDSKRTEKPEPPQEEIMEAPEEHSRHKTAPAQEPAVSYSTEKESAESRKAAWQTDTAYSQESEKGPGIFEKIRDKLLGILSKIGQILQKIKCTFRNFYDKIKAILEKKDRLVCFITEEPHLRALEKAKQELLKLLRRSCPRVLKANIHYGFDDPCLTGQVLAAVSALYPFVGEHTQITPDFQEKVLEGNIRLKGKIFVVHLAALAVNMLLSSDVRRTIKDVREFKL